MTKTNPLSEFRKLAPRPRNAGLYEACGVSSEPQRHLEIRPRFPDPAEAPSYGFLRHIRSEWRYGQQVTLFFTHPMQVIIDGRNLTQLFRDLQKGKVEWIQEFDPEEWAEEPTDPNAPFIEKIDIKTAHDEEPPPISQRH